MGMTSELGPACLTCVVAIAQVVQLQKSKAQQREAEEFMRNG